MVLLQTSQESPDIFRMVHRVNTAQDVATMRAGALSAGLTEQEVTAYLVYCSGFYGNTGKYKVF